MNKPEVTAHAPVPTLANIAELTGGKIAHTEICHSPCPKGREDTKEPTPILQLGELGAFPLKTWLPDANGRLRWKAVDLVALVAKVAALRAQQGKKAKGKKDPSTTALKGSLSGVFGKTKKAEAKGPRQRKQLAQLVARHEGAKVIVTEVNTGKVVAERNSPVGTCFVAVRLNGWMKIRCSAHESEAEAQATIVTKGERPDRDFVILAI